MTTSPEGLTLIKAFEGCRLTAYRDSANVLTIGYGHTGSDVSDGQTITQEEADAFLVADIGWAERAVTHLVFAPITQAQFDALVSFVFNLGAGALQNSHLLLYLNQKHYAMAAAEFTRWNMAGGQVLLGLVRRRFAEGTRFLEGTA